MPETSHFRKEDIGGEILPILTTGLYRDSLDAIREYIQNSIDANASAISIRIDPTTVVVADDGAGMDLVEAEKAIRLGISDKSPLKKVGFRGIGIYSAFNLCNLLEIFTKKKGKDAKGRRIVFNFGEMRKQLLIEQERRKQGQPHKLYLEKLLTETVFVVDNVDVSIPKYGTRVVLSDLLPESNLAIQDWNTVVRYLQDVVPLPFSPKFKFGPQIERRFEEQDYRVVPLELEIEGRREPLYRPYLDEQFSADATYPPKFFSLDGFGFAWVCVNGRRVFRDPTIRGLLIKKFGFSIGSRSYLEPYFKRTVFNRRITGEIIIQNNQLLPNAARSDFENNSARQGFLQEVQRFIGTVSRWANDIQEDEKARQVLAVVHEELLALAEELPKMRRDKDKILAANVNLNDCDHRLQVHRKRLLVLADVKDEYNSAKRLLAKSHAFVKDALRTSADERRKIERDVETLVQEEARGRDVVKSRTPEDRPKDLVAALEACGLVVPDDAQWAIRLFETEFLFEQIDKSTYRELLGQLVEAIEQGS